MTAAEEEAWCPLYKCLCCWRIFCSPRIARVAPGKDYVCMAAGADDRPAWSLLVGFHSFPENGLRLHRFRVARSGRILGRSDDVLEVLHNFRDRICSASATLTPDGRSLCLLRSDFEGATQALQVQLDNLDKLTVLPHLLMERRVSCCPISAAGHIWAPYAHLCLVSRTFRVVMQRLTGEKWEQVGDPFIAPYKGAVPPGPWNGRFLQGYAVLRKDSIILVSLKKANLFFTFDCSAYAWTQVTTQSYGYIPILGRGVYIEEDDTVYMLRSNTIYAYKLAYDDDRRRLKLERPIKIDSVCPFSEDQGYGFLTHLGGRLMCSVWISVHLGCSCHNLHAVITTFRLTQSCKGIKVFHSTCRRVDMLPSKPQLNSHEFSFLQEYKDELNHWNPDPVLLEEDTTSSHVVKASQMIDCCRIFFTEDNLFPSPVVLVKPAIHINKDLYIICQAGSQTIICKTNIMNVNGRLGDHGETLQWCYSIHDDGDDHHMLEQPLLWQFVCSSSDIYAITYIQDGIHVFGLDKELSIFYPSAWPVADPFVMVIQVGQRTIALTDSLQVFHHTTRFHDATQSTWQFYGIDRSHVCNRKVKLSGYAAVGDHAFIVSDTDTSSCLFFDLSVKQWRVVMPYAAFKFCDVFHPSTLPGERLLNGRSVYVEGFIYTCKNVGLAAYELLQEGDSMYLSDPIFLSFSWLTSWDSEKMCLDYAGKDMISGAIIFCVVQGEYSPPGSRSHDVRITTVQVKTVRACSEKMKPVGIDHVGCLTLSVEHEKKFSTRSCFAVGS